MNHLPDVVPRVGDAFDASVWFLWGHPGGRRRHSSRRGHCLRTPWLALYVSAQPGAYPPSLWPLGTSTSPRCAQRTDPLASKGAMGISPCARHFASGSKGPSRRLPACRSRPLFFASGRRGVGPLRQEAPPGASPSDSALCLTLTVQSPLRKVGARLLTRGECSAFHGGRCWKAATRPRPRCAK